MLLLVLHCLLVNAQKTIHDTRALRDGDLLFVVAPQPNAITEVTKIGTQLPIDHVAIFFRQGKTPMVIEAAYDGVTEKTFDIFAKSAGQMLIGRVRGDFDAVGSIQRARTYVGRPYDFVFLPGNEAVYCSELVQLSYVNKSGQSIFETVPMLFHDESGQVTPYWCDFYARRAMDVPEGQPGTNPGVLSRRKCVKIKYKWAPFDMQR